MAQVLKLAFAAELLQDVLPVFDTFLKEEHSRTRHAQPFYRSGPLLRSYIDQILRRKRIVPHTSDENAPESLVKVLRLLEVCVRSKVGAGDGPGAERKRSLPKLQQLRARIKRPKKVQVANTKTGGNSVLDWQPQSYARLPNGLDLYQHGAVVCTFAAYLEDLQGKSDYQSPLDAPILPTQQSAQRFPSPKYRPFADALYDALAKGVQCTGGNANAPTHTHALNLCLYCAKMYDYTGEDIDLELTITNHRNEWKACRFTWSARHRVSNDGAIIDKICETLDDSLPTNDTLHFSTNGCDFWQEKLGHGERMDYAANNGRFLHEHLDHGQWDLLLEAKRKLMVIIARAFTQLFRSKWMQDDWTRRSILLFPAKDQVIPNVVLPFLSADILGKTRQSSESSGPRLSDIISRGNPLLRQLGILLVEVENGASTETARTLLAPGLSENDPAADDYAKAHFIYQGLAPQLYGPLRSVIELCLYPDKCPSQLRDPNCHDTILIRELLDTHIVKPLEKELRNAIYPRELSAGTSDFLQCDTSHFRTRTTKEASSNLAATAIVHAPANETSGSLYALQSNKSMFFDQTDHPKDKIHYCGVNDWFCLYEERVLKARGLKSSKKGERLKIAVLDTCIDRTKPNLRGMGKRLQDVKRFYPSSNESQSPEKRWHGSHVVALLHRMAPFADIYVAEIAGVEDVLNDGILKKAVEHAMINREGWKANILVMSFGWDSQEASSKFPLFYQALENNNMPHSPRIVFAAASNGGANYPRTYPATSGSVFAIHATDYNGDAPTPNFNPTRASNPMNYSTIGHQVPGDSDLDHLRVSGTSFAAPVAAGIAAAVIEFFRQRDVGIEWDNYLRTYDGMRKVFNKMVVKRGDYDYLDWASFFHPTGTPEQIHDKILDALKRPN